MIPNPPLVTFGRAIGIPGRGFGIRRATIASGTAGNLQSSNIVITNPFVDSSGGAVDSPPWFVGFPSGVEKSTSSSQRAWPSWEENLQKDANEDLDLHKLNADFWGPYKTVSSMARAREKREVIRIVDNFALIRRRHPYLFQKLKNTILNDMLSWSAPELAHICNSWTQLRFMQEDLLVSMAGRVVKTVFECNAVELCWLLDAYAASRCSIESVNEVLRTQTILAMDEFTVPQLCLHISSFARLGITDRLLFGMAAERIVNAKCPIPAIHLTMAAYAFSRAGYGHHSPYIFDAISSRSVSVAADFEAKDIQMLLLSVARAGYHSEELLAVFSKQCQRRIAQFNGHSLALILRAFAFFGDRQRNNALYTQVVGHLPRAAMFFRPCDMISLLVAFTAAGIESEAFFDVVTPYLVQHASLIKGSDWLLALKCYARFERCDDLFLSAMAAHLDMSKLSPKNVLEALDDCRKLPHYKGSLLLNFEAVIAQG